MRAVLTLSVVSLFIAGCMSVSPEGQKVRITTNGGAIQGCEFVGNVNSSSMMAGAVGLNRTEADLQNQTAALGGNVVFLNTSFSGAGKLAMAARTTGEAYRCS